MPTLIINRYGNDLIAKAGIQLHFPINKQTEITLLRSAKVDLKTTALKGTQVA